MRPGGGGDIDRGCNGADTGECSGTCGGDGDNDGEPASVTAPGPGGGAGALPMAGSPNRAAWEARVSVSVSMSPWDFQNSLGPLG